MSAAKDFSKDHSLDEMNQFAHRLADASQVVCNKYFRGDFSLEDKADESPVTQADKEAEAVMRALIESEMPEHGIFGEEHGIVGKDRDYVWVLDPIDGTRAFATGLPIYGTLVSLLYKGEPIYGLCNMPSISERYTSLETKDLRVSPIEALEQVRLRFTSHEIFSQQEMPVITALSQASRFTHPGGDCYNYCLLATGHCELVIEAGLQPYDFLALEPIVRAAGGLMTDWHGQALTLNSGGQVIASANQTIHEQALKRLNAVAA